MPRPFESLMLRVLLAPLLAVLHLFGVYVLIHGHYGPGGGFVAGILVAAAMILPRLVGWAPERLSLSTRGAAVTAVTGILLIEIGVALAVAGSMLALFNALTGKLGEAHRR